MFSALCFDPHACITVGLGVLGIYDHYHYTLYVFLLLLLAVSFLPLFTQAIRPDVTVLVDWV